MKVEIGTLVFIACFLMFAVLVNVAGGAVIVPFAIYFLGYSTAQAVAFSNSVILLNATSKYVMGLRKTNLNYPYKTIVNYNILILMAPICALFGVLGGITLSVLPKITTSAVLTIVIIIGIYIGYGNLQKYTQKQESKHQQLSAKKDITEPLVQKEVELTKIPQKTEKVEATPDTVKEQESEAIKEIKRSEGTNFHPKKFKLILAITAATVIYALLRGGKKAKSLIGIKKCTGEDWLLLGVYILSMAYINYRSYAMVMTDQAHKRSVGYSEEFEIDGDRASSMIVVAGVIGYLGTLAALGGGVLLNPYLIKMGVTASVSSWTINMLTMMFKFAAVLIHWKKNDILEDYVLFYGLILSVCILISENLVLTALKKYDTEKFLLLTYLGVSLFCLITVLFTSWSSLTEVLDAGQSLWTLGKYC